MYHETPNDSRDSKFQNSNIKGFIDRKGRKLDPIMNIKNSHKSTHHGNKDLLIFNEVQKVDFREMSESNKVDKDSIENEKEIEELKISGLRQQSKLCEGRNDSFDPENSEEGVQSSNIK